MLKDRERNGPAMSENITARDLMSLAFLRLGSGHSLREAVSILLNPEAGAEGRRVLIVLNPDGSFAGTLTTRFMLRALLPEWADSAPESQDGPEFERRLHDAMQEKMELTVADAMNPNVPTVEYGERLPHLIEIMLEKRLDCMPVIEAGRVVGVVYLTDVFVAAARLALAAQANIAPRKQEG